MALDTVPHSPLLSRKTQTLIQGVSPHINTYSRMFRPQRTVCILHRSSKPSDRSSDTEKTAVKEELASNSSVAKSESYLKAKTRSTSPVPNRRATEAVFGSSMNRNCLPQDQNPKG